MTVLETNSRIRELIAGALDASGREPIQTIADDEFLPSLLDSVVLSALLVMIEDEWEFEVADEDIEPELFETVETLSRFVESKTSNGE